MVVVVLDDTGFAQLGCFGSGLRTPAVDALAAGGLRYTRFHVTAMCSPTRASLLTGRNAHAVGMGFLADIPLSYPGYTARLPPSAATLPRLLRDAGYSTMAVGKWHLVPRFERSAAGPFDHWPLGVGFERFYGFLQGDANHWAPNLVVDNHAVDPPTGPGYHLSQDLVDQAIRMVLDQQQAAPGKPFLLYVALGATHAPHQVDPAWVEPYRGAFDDGWDAWRRQVFDRQLALGVVPEGTVLTPRPPWIDDWASLPAGERRMHARQQEVFAGFLSHADAQIGRLVAFLAGRGLLDDTLLLLVSDNGASAEGGRLGSVNEHRFTARLPDSVVDNVAALADWGGPGTYPHYSWGWAWAGNTPLRLWKRYTWLGGTRTPLVVHWPAAIADAGALRTQFAHVVDLLPTIVDAAGVAMPDAVDGVVQQPVDGASLCPTFSDAAAPSPRTTQYFELLGSRSIVHGRWKATTDHVSAGVLDEEALLVGSRRFEDDHWALFDIDADFSESTDVAADHPEVVAELQRRWEHEAARNQVLPIADGLMGRFSALVGPLWPSPPCRVLVPGGGPVADEALPALFGGFTLVAEVVVSAAGAAGVLCAMGDGNGGLALFVDGGCLVFTLARADGPLEVAAAEPVPAGQVALGVTCTVGGTGGDRITLFHGTRAVASVPYDGVVPVVFQHGGAGLRLGADVGLPVSARYRPPFAWTGTLLRLHLRTPGRPADPVAEVRAALHSD